MYILVRPGWLHRLGRAAERPGSPWLARSRLAIGRATWVALAGLIDLDDMLSDVARLGWLDLPANENPNT